MCKVETKDISVYYHTGLVLDNVSINIEKGEFAVVFGPNGSGKTTLLKSIAGLIKPQSGRIIINGRNIDDAKTKGLIGYVPQNYEHGIEGFPATVKEIVSLGLITGNYDVKNHKSANHIVDHMLKLVDATHLKNRLINELSGGEKQRVMVARALASNPELLLLDEPTSGIDIKASSKIYETLGFLNENLKITIIMVSHDIDNAVNHASKVICINRHLCFCGNSTEFKATHQDSHLFFK
ncbi:metal ABC transporter ATP-binding protein [Selenomonadales bacterium OttesenSCG-928-I06]|nr:metal ABC transporter ATP-binding protein [Selenomonadales bacterium OttesenSCG-928-I06]